MWRIRKISMELEKGFVLIPFAEITLGRVSNNTNLYDFYVKLNLNHAKAYRERRIRHSRGGSSLRWITHCS